MSNAFQTEAAEMHSASQHVHDVVGQIQGQLSALEARLEPLQGAWQGTAAVAFHQLKERWHTDVQKLVGALTDIAEALERTGQTYTTTDEDQQSAITGIGSALSA